MFDREYFDRGKTQHGISRNLHDAQAAARQTVKESTVRGACLWYESITHSPVTINECSIA